jgi:hypothetical protein
MAQPYYNPGSTPLAGGMVQELMDAFERVQSAFEAASDRGIDILDAGALISSDAKILDFRHPLKAVVAGDRTVAVTMNAECGSGEVPATRRINTVFPLRGGGDLSQDRTHSVADATTTSKGVVQIAAPGETSSSKVVRADDPRLEGGGGVVGGGFFVLMGGYVPDNEGWEEYGNIGGHAPYPQARFPVPHKGHLTSFAAIVHGGTLTQRLRLEVMINGYVGSHHISFLPGEVNMVKTTSEFGSLVNPGDLISFSVDTDVLPGPPSVNCFVDAVVMFEKA